MTRFVRRSDGRIRATADFDIIVREPTETDPGEIIPIRIDDLGGTIENIKNLSQDGTCWVFPDAMIKDNARVTNDAIIAGTSVVSDNARIYGKAWIEDSEVRGNARVLGSARVLHESIVEGNAKVSGDCIIDGRPDYTITHAENVPSIVSGNAIVQGNSRILGGNVLDDAKILDTALIEGTVRDRGYVAGCAYVDPKSTVQDDARLSGCAKLYNTVMEGSAIVYNDNVIIDQDGQTVVEGVVNSTVTDASYVTGCPDKGSKECCQTIGLVGVFYPESASGVGIPNTDDPELASLLLAFNATQAVPRLRATKIAKFMPEPHDWETIEFTPPVPYSQWSTLGYRAFYFLQEEVYEQYTLKFIDLETREEFPLPPDSWETYFEFEHEDLVYRGWFSNPQYNARIAAMSLVERDHLTWDTGKTKLEVSQNVATMFFALLGKKPMTYTIDWGDGTVETVASSPATHTYTAVGNYTVRLDVENEVNGNVNTATTARTANITTIP